MEGWSETDSAANNGLTVRDFLLFEFGSMFYQDIDRIESNFTQMVNNSVDHNYAAKDWTLFDSKL